MPVTWQDITSDPSWESLSPFDRSAVRAHYFNEVMAPNIPEEHHDEVFSDFQRKTDPSITPAQKPNYLQRAFGGTPMGTLVDALSPGDSTSKDIAIGATRGVTRAARGIGMAAAATSEYLPQNQIADRLSGRNSTDDTFAAVDRARDFENSLPEPKTTGAKIAQGAGGFLTGLGTAGIGSAGAAGSDIVKNGGSVDDAQSVTALEAGTDMLGLGLGRFGKTLGQRLVRQVTAGGVLNEAGRRAENAYLPDDQQRQFDPVDFGIGAGSAAAGAFFPGHQERSAPIKRGDDLLGGGSATPAPSADTSGIAPDADTHRGYAVLRGTDGTPYGLAPQGGGMVPLNGRDANAVIDGRQQLAPFQRPDQPGTVRPADNAPIDSTARDVTPPDQLALPALDQGGPKRLLGPADFVADQYGNIRRREGGDLLALPAPEENDPRTVYLDNDGKPVEQPEGSPQLNINPENRVQPLPPDETSPGVDGRFDKPKVGTNVPDLGTPEGLSVARATQVLTERFGKTAQSLLDDGKLHIVASAEDLPSEATDQLHSADGSLHGVHDTQTGESWVVADSLTPRTAAAVMLHEAGVHYGMARLMGADRMQRLAGQLRVIHQTGKAGDKALIETALTRAGKEPEGVHDEELVAHAVEQAEAARAGGTLSQRMQVWVSDVVSAIKGGLYNHGMLNVKHLNLGDIRHLAEGAMRKIARDGVNNSTKRGTVAEALLASRSDKNEDTTKPVAGDRSGSAGDAAQVRGGQEGSNANAAVGDAEDAGVRAQPSPESGSEANRLVDNEGAESGAPGKDSEVVEHDITPDSRDANLKQWFGHGVLKNKDGSPTEFYRRDNHDLTKWDHERAGSATSSPGSALGMFVDASKEVPEGYGENMTSGYARLKNPAVLDLRETAKNHLQSLEGAEALRNDLIEKGHDGIYFKDADQVVLFDPNRDFKRADNHGTFDEHTPHFLFSRSDRDETGDLLSRGKEAAHGVVESARDLGKAISSTFAPMAGGTDVARATAKDWANSVRTARYEASVADKELTSKFKPDQLKKMWEAADEQSVAMQSGKATKGIGLDKLAPDERAAVEKLQTESKAALEAAINAGMYDDAGLPSYVPRMVVRMTAEGAERMGSRKTAGTGGKVTSSTPQMIARKHLTAAATEAAAQGHDEEAQLVRNIRTLPLATSKLREAVAGRQFINKIKEIGDSSETPLVVEGNKPADDENGKWFTLPNEPAFYTWKPRIENDPDREGKIRYALDVNHDRIYDKVPLYIRSDFEDPIRAVLGGKAEENQLYQGLMSAKAKTTGIIMYSPVIHNLVEWGRAFPALPGKVLTMQVYGDGKRALADPAVMRRALENGLAPIGGHGQRNDISSIAESPKMEPGNSWTAKALGYVPGLFDKNAGDAVKTWVDTAGNFWHNTLLWDMVARLQMGLYSNFEKAALKAGADPQTAARVAAHQANRYAGSLPKEAMSSASRMMTNLMMFSRTFTLGNLGLMKDAITGLPKDVQSQILRDAGSEMLTKAVKFNQRKSQAAVGLDIGLNYISNSLLQNAAAVIAAGGVGGAVAASEKLRKEMAEYAVRFNDLVTKIEKNPLQALNVFGNINSLTPMSANEPDRQNRVLVGHSADGTAIYMRNPLGKVGEDLAGWMSDPIRTFKAKFGTLMRPTFDIVANDRGFGRKIYDPNATGVEGAAENFFTRVLPYIVGTQLPLQAIQGAKDTIEGHGDKTLNILRVTGPLAGLTFSQGAPGGEAEGERYKTLEELAFRKQEGMPAVRKKIQAGDIQGAVSDMTQMGIEPATQKYYIKTAINPASRMTPNQLRKFMLAASPEERERMLNDLNGRAN